MAKRKTIGDNPLDLVIPSQKTKTDLTATSPPLTPPPKPKKERLTIHLPVELIDRVKNAVYWTAGLTLASLAEEAFSKILDDMERENGEKFPPRKAELKGGRPLK